MPHADNAAGGLIAQGSAPALTGNPYGDHESREGLLVIGNAEGGCEDGLPFLTASNLGKTVNNQTPLIAHALRGEGFDASEDGTGRGTPLVPVAFNSRQDPDVSGDVAGPLDTVSPQAQAIAFYGWAVRRLTPRECERLMGMKDDYTRIAWRGKPPERCPDGPRYKALGNSIGVPQLEWIGRRIDQCDRLIRETGRKAGG